MKHLAHLDSSLTITSRYTWALVFATIHEQPFPLFRCCGIGSLGSVPLAPGKIHTSLFCFRSEMVLTGFISNQEPDFISDRFLI